jgi:carbon starvation protein CstA
MFRAFSVTFKVMAMLGLLLAGLVILGQQREWEVPLTWTLVLGGVWAAILVRVVVLVSAALEEDRARASLEHLGRDEGPAGEIFPATGAGAQD